MSFIADKVFPTVPVLKESDLVAIYDREFFFRFGTMQARGLGARPAATGYEIKQARYQITEWAEEHLIDDRVRQNADQPLDPDLAGMRLLTTHALIHRDTLWTQQFFNTGIWGTDWTGVASGPTGNQFTQWDQSNSDPIQFVRNRINDVGGKTGYRPNVGVMGPTAFEAALNHPDIVDRLKYTQGPAGYPGSGADAAKNVLAALFGLDRIEVPYSVSNTAHEGQAESTAYIVTPTSMLLAYAAAAPSITEPSAGYTFAYTGLLPGVTNAFGGVIERGREELAHSDVLQIRAAYDMLQVATELGEFFQTVVSSSYGEATF
jgi:hypothetical protein